MAKIPDYKPSGGAVPAAINRKRVAGAEFVARPAYANMNVRLVVIRHLQGFQTGVGLVGAVVASKDVTLAEAQKLMAKVKRKWGRLITKKIPNIGLDILDINTDKMDNYDYEGVDRRGAAYNFVPGMEQAPTPAPAVGMVNSAIKAPPKF